MSSVSKWERSDGIQVGVAHNRFDRKLAVAFCCVDGLESIVIVVQRIFLY